MIVVKVMTGTPLDEAIDRAIEVRNVIISGKVRELVFLKYIDLEIEITTNIKQQLLEEAFCMIKAKYLNENLNPSLSIPDKKHWLDEVVEMRKKNINKNEDYDDIPF